MDTPERLLAAVVRRLPAARDDWGAAMRAELASITGSGSRWRFVVGCAWATVRANGGSAPRRAVVVAIAAAAIGTVIYANSARLHLFAIVFAVELAVCGWLGWARAAGHRRATTSGSAALRVAVSCGVTGSVALAAYAVARFPSAGADPSHVFAPVFATALAAYLMVALAPPRALVADKTTRRYALIGAAFVVALGAAGLAVTALLGHGPALPVGVVAVPGVLIIGVRAGRATGDPVSGLSIGVWTGLVGALTLFAGVMTGTFIDARTQSPEVAAYNVGDNLGGLISMLVLLPPLLLAVTTVGAAIGSTIATPARHHPS
jgi:hypothetical protein